MGGVGPFGLGQAREHGERQALDGGIVGQRHGGRLPPARARGKRLRGDRPQASGWAGRMIGLMLAYTRWASALVLDCLAEAPPALLEAPQAVVFGSILRTAHHGH
jgi:hypothetical protein